MNRRKRLLPLIIGAAAVTLLILFLAGVFLYRRGMIIPRWSEFKDQRFQTDFNGDGIPDTVTLKNRRLRVSAGDSEGGSGAAPQILFETESGWRVSDAAVGDVNRDGEPELVMLVWKRGSYGYAKPFWVEKDEQSYSQHVFIYHWDQREERIRSLWMSSKIGLEAAHFELDADMHIHLVMPDGTDTEWMWGSWGLVLVGSTAPE